eukprot:GEMP01021981.1.p1 GENE.GEMP01021981.1~~GEMP01021981.1.p1  ORF type:complete len:810 (+),score=149.30 GEMP01021981.1:73-2430(+)
MFLTHFLLHAVLAWQVSDDDQDNVQMIHDSLTKSYYANYGPTRTDRQLFEDVRQEVDRMPRSPQLKLAIGLAKYNFFWFKGNTTRMDIAAQSEGAALLMDSLAYAKCLDEKDNYVFMMRGCHTRFPYLILMFTELGREFAIDHDMMNSLQAYSNALHTFEAMKKLPYYIKRRWKMPLDVNFNSDVFPQMFPNQPIWRTDEVPIAQWLERNFAVILKSFAKAFDNHPELFDALHYENINAEGQCHAPEEGWRQTRTELTSCPASTAMLVRLRPGGVLKAHFGASGRLATHLTLRQGAPGAYLFVGNSKLYWQTGKAHVFDDTYIHGCAHSGDRTGNAEDDRYILHLLFCHPCEAEQQHLFRSDLCTPLEAPLGETALWVSELPDLAQCDNGISQQCPPDTQHGGVNPLSALNAWRYALNILKALAKSHDAFLPLVEPAGQLIHGIETFLETPAVELFLPIVSGCREVLNAAKPLLALHPTVALPIDQYTPVEVPERVKLDRTEMPMVGFGTWKMDGATCTNAVLEALRLGVRHIDTAEAYQNEGAIGQAIRRSGVPREELFIATKATSVALGMAPLDATEDIFSAQLRELGTTYVDVYMLHAVGVKGDELRTLWAILEGFYDAGKVRALGLSNASIDDINEVLSFARVKPSYVQNIFKVYKPGEQILTKSTVSIPQYCKQKGIQMVAYSVVTAWPHILPPMADPSVRLVASQVKRSPSQVLHRWVLQHGIGVIPKAATPEHIAENAKLLDFSLNGKQMALLDSLATLSESTAEFRPPWMADPYQLR